MDRRSLNLMYTGSLGELLSTIRSGVEKKPAQELFWLGYDGVLPDNQLTLTSAKLRARHHDHPMSLLESMGYGK